MSKDKAPMEFWQLRDKHGDILRTVAIEETPMSEDFVLSVVSHEAYLELEAKLAECVAENEQLKQELKMINEWAVKASLDDAFKAYHSLKETLAKVKK